MPRVSVVMPVYDVAPFVGAAVRSVLAQTFGDLELVVVDDGSTDGTPDVVEAIGDPRVRLVREDHHGYVAATNRGVELAGGEFLARADGDDIYSPTLFEKELAVLAEHPGTVAVGAWIRQFGGREACWTLPVDPGDIRRFLRYGCALSQPVMMRRTAFDEVGGLRPVRWEDWDLWVRLAARADLRNVPEFLILRRFRPTSVYHSPGRVARRRANLQARWTAVRMLGVDRHSGFVLARNVASLPVYRAIERFLPTPPPPPPVTSVEPTVTVVVAGVAGIDTAGATSAAERQGADEVVVQHGEDLATCFASGARAASSDVVAFVDASTVVGDGWLGEVRRAFLDLTVGMVGGRPAAGDGIVVEGGAIELHPDVTRYGEVVSVPLANSALRRDLVPAAEDELTSSPGTLGEEVRRRGLRVVYHPWMEVRPATRPVDAAPAQTP